MTVILHRGKMMIENPLSKFIGVGVILLSLNMISAAQHSRFALKLAGGLGRYSVGDTNSFYKDSQQNTGHGPLDTVHAGWNSLGEILFFVNKRGAISLGSGFNQIKKNNNSVSWETGNYNYSETYDAKITSVPILLGVYYFFPLSPKTSFFLQGGFSYSLCWWSHKKHVMVKNPDIGYDYWYEEKEKADSHGPGFFFGLGMELNISHHFALAAGGYFDYAPITNFKGEYIFTDPNIDLTDTPVQGHLYFYKYYNAYSEKWVTSLQITGRPVGSGARDVEKATVDLTAAALKVGIIIRF
jgi:hypothetical protein